MAAKYYDKSTKTGVTSDSMASVASMPSTWQQGAVGVLSNGKIIYAGGHTTNNVVNRGGYLYDSSLDQWSVLPDMPVYLDNAIGVALNDGRFMVATGFKCPTGNNQLAVNNDASYVYDPVANAWSVYAFAVDAGASFGDPVLLSDGRVFLCGGVPTVGSACLANAQIFDPTTNTWTQVASMPAGRRLHRCVVLADGRVLVIGGRLTTNASANTTTTCVIYDPVANTWVTAGSMNTARAIPAVGRHPQTGKVGAMGGTNAGGNITSCELYDPTTDAWTAGTGATQSTGGPYECRGSAVLPDGRLYGFGIQGSARATTDLMDLVANSIAAGPSFAGNRVFCGGAVLPDGRVIAIGGSTGAAVLATAEAMTPAAVRVTHGLQGNGGLAPHLIIPEFTADPSASARVFTGEKGTTFATIGTPGCATALRTHTWRFNSAID